MAAPPRFVHYSPRLARRPSDSLYHGPSAFAMRGIGAQERAKGIEQVTALTFPKLAPHSTDVAERGGDKFSSAAVRPKLFGGSQNWVLDNCKGKDVAVMVAGNSGHPGGRVTYKHNVLKRRVGCGHKGQEEDIVSSWLTAKGVSAFDCVRDRWGMANPGTGSVRTVQGVDYSSAMDPQLFADAWLVREGAVCRKYATSTDGNQFDGIFDSTDKIPVRLVFVAGPNGGCDQGPNSATRATLCAAAVRDVKFLKAGARQAIRAGLDAMIAEHAQVAVLAWISTGIYAPAELRAHMQSAIPELVGELLREGVGPARIPRSHFFEQVVLPDIALPTAADLKDGITPRPKRQDVAAASRSHAGGHDNGRGGGGKAVARKPVASGGLGVTKTVSKQKTTGPFKSIKSLLRASSEKAKQAPTP